MASAAAEIALQIVIVAAGALVTLLIGGAVVYWVRREWRDTGARPGHAKDAPAPPDVETQGDDSQASQPSGS